MSLIQNPILRGFNADPSIIRVEDTYYIANSTFEWFPGVRLHESKDLKNWNLLPSPLSTTTLLDMKGNPSSGGIWAPALSSGRRAILVGVYRCEGHRRRL